MPENNDAFGGKNSADINPPSMLVKAYVDEKIKEAIKQYEESQTKSKKWKNSWRAASPITKGSFLMTVAIAAGTIAYTITAVLTLLETHQIAKDNGIQTQNLIDAANQMKVAGYTFSGAAIGINNATWNAFGQLKLQEKQMENSRQSADVEAQNSLKATQEQMRLDQRPWLSVTDFVTMGGTVTTGSETSNGLFWFDSLKFIVQNSGKTPALNVAYSQMAFCRRVGERVDDYDTEVAKIPGSRFLHPADRPDTVIPPGSTVPVNMPGSGCPDRDNSRFPKNWPMATLVLGKITYNDVFKNSPIHTTEFCVERIQTSTLTTCSHGNKMD